MDNMVIGDIHSIPETAFGFRTKMLLFKERLELLRKKIQKEKASLRILDVGCGTGMYITLPLGQEGYSVIGIDPHTPSITCAKEKNCLTNVKFIAGNVEEIRAGETFDAIILSDILEHLSNPEKFLNMFKDMLSPEGILLVSIPNGFGPFEIENFILRKTGILRLGRFLRDRWRRVPERFIQSLNHESGHIQFFTRKNFEALALRAGFKITHFEAGSFLCGPVTSRIISQFSPLTRLNIMAGRRLPYFLSSVWYYELSSSSHHQPQ